MNNDIHSPHDKFFKDTFSRKESAIGFLQGSLPRELVSLIDFESLEIVSGEYIDETFKHSSSDLVYKVNLGGKPAYLYFLFEHQSTVDPLMAYRLLKYMVRLWESLLKTEPELKKLPPIFPQVLYQGKSVWQVSRDFGSLVDCELVDGEAAILKRFIPNFEYLLTDLVRQDSDKIVGDLYGQLALLLMKGVAEGTLLETISRHGDIIQALFFEDNPLVLLEKLIRYTMAVDESIDIERLQQTISDAVSAETGEKVMTTIAEKLISEGMIKGLSEGRSEGMVKGRSEGIVKGRSEGMVEGEVRLLEKQLKLKFPNAASVNLKGLSLIQLETIGQRILTCDTLDEAVKGIL